MLSLGGTEGSSVTGFFNSITGGFDSESHVLVGFEGLSPEEVRFSSTSSSRSGSPALDSGLDLDKTGAEGRPRNASR